MADSNDQLCAIEINSAADRDTTVPNVTQYCATLGKPWFLAAWSSCLAAPNQFPGDLDHFASDAEMADHAHDMYAVERNQVTGHPAPSYPAVGSDFWNLGNKTDMPTCDISPAFPMTFAVVQSTAP